MNNVDWGGFKTGIVLCSHSRISASFDGLAWDGEKGNGSGGASSTTVREGSDRGAKRNGG